MTKNILRVRLPHTRQVLSVKLYIPETDKLRGVVQFCHGLNEHISRYEEFIEFLTERGYVVFGADQLGHGDTAVESRLERGDIEYAGGYSMRDASLYAASVVLKRFQKLPWFVVAHSMGSIVTRLMAQENRNISGMVLIGTNLAGPRMFYMYFLSRIIGVFRGKNYKSKMMDNMFGKQTYGRVKGITRRPEWLTHDSEMLKEFVSDETTKFRLFCKAYAELLKMNMNTCRVRDFKPANPNIGILLASGTEDPLAENGTAIYKIAEGYRKNGVQDIEVNMYMGCRHCILHEVSRRDIFRDIVNWLDDRSLK